MKPRYFNLAFLVLFIASFMMTCGRSVHAETTAEKVFGKWERITVAQILKPVREFEYQEQVAGSIQPKPAPAKSQPIYCNRRGPYGNWDRVTC